MASSDMSQVVLTRVEGAVLVITLNRPHARNAIDMAVAHAMAAALKRLDADPELSVAVLTGAGGVFCAGMDLKAFAAGDYPVFADGGFAGLTRAQVAKPLIAAVEGWALGGGLEIALACDLIVASESAKFGMPEAKRGLVATEGGVIRLPRRLPYHVAMEALLTGEPIEAARAASFGMVNRLVPEGQALEEAMRLAHAIAGNAPLSLAMIKKVVRRSQGLTEAAAFELQDPMYEPLLTSADAQEGARAFAEKRKPMWVGK